MEFRDVIIRNMKQFPYGNWPEYAFHYTDVSNAVNILTSGQLLSRRKAIELGLMKNNNASSDVIGNTQEHIASYARLYFRPLTPTQYHNEGYKHQLIRFSGGDGANVPVPVFFLFNLQHVLERKGTLFSEQSQAGSGAPLYSSASAFEKLNFAQIYKNGPMEDPVAEKHYRQAEILVPDSLPLDECLEFILCRSSAEKMTLLCLLSDLNLDVYNRFKSIISLPKDNHQGKFFYGNGLSVTSCDVLKNTANIDFTVNYYCNRYTNTTMARLGQNELPPIGASTQFEFYHNREVIFKKDYSYQIDYRKGTHKTFDDLPDIPSANHLRTTTYLDGKVVNYQKFIRNQIIIQ